MYQKDVNAEMYEIYKWGNKIYIWLSQSGVVNTYWHLNEGVPFSPPGWDTYPAAKALEAGVQRNTD